MVGQLVTRFVQILALILVLNAAAVSAKEPVPEPLRAGLVEYALAVGDLPGAMARVPGLTGDAAEFLRGRVLYESGRVDEGVEVLERVVEGDHFRGAASLLLAEAARERHDASEARHWLRLAARHGHGEDRQKALYGLAELERAAGHVDKAGEILAGMSEGYWAAVGYMNLATDYAREDLNPTRALVALRVALAMAKADGHEDRKRQLRDRLLVRAGELAYRNEEYEKAIRFLEQVSLDSFSTPQALYFHGLALAKRGNHRAAMQSWHRARKFPLAYPGVSDAWIGMGRGYDLAGYLGQSGEAYLAANAAYESERVNLRELSDRIRRNGAYKTLVVDARDRDVEWFLADSRTLTQPRLAYLLDFMTAPDAQRAVQRVAMLAAMEERLSQRQADIRTLRDAASRLAGSKGRDSSQKDEDVQQQQELLEQRLAALDALAQTTSQKSKLAQIKKQLLLVKGRVRVGHSPGDVSGLAPEKAKTQLAELRTANDRHLQAARALRKRAEQALDELALAYVAEQDERFAHAIDKTEQQIAHLYEYLALENLEEDRL